MVDWNKPIETRDGRPARLLGSIKASSNTAPSMVCAVRLLTGDEKALHFFESGAFGFRGNVQAHDLDLLNSPEPVDYYFVIKGGVIHDNITWHRYDEACDKAEQVQADGLSKLVVTGAKVQHSFIPITDFARTTEVDLVLPTI